MAQKVKKQFFKILPWSVAMLMIFALAIGIWQGLPADEMKAAAGDGASSNIQLLDSNNNGKLDRITFDIANPNLETWSLNGTSPYGLSVTQGGNAITISSVTFTTATNVNPVTVQVDLDETDTDLLFNTDGVSTGVMELIYTQAGYGSTPNIQDSVDEELNAIATGDTGATDTENDSAAPAIVDLDIYDTGTADGLIDQIIVTWSENVDTDDSAAPVLADFGVITLPDGSSVTSASITDPAGTSATVTLSSVVGQGTANTAVGSTGIDGITNEWTDGANLTSNPDDNESITDSAAPYVTNRSTVDADSNGKIDYVVFNTSENLDDDFSGLTVAVTGYTLAGTPYDTAGSANDDVFRVALTENAGTCDITAQAGCDTGATPNTQITANTTLSDSSANNIATDSAAVAASDGANPVVVGRATLDTDSNGQIDRIGFVASETLNDNFGDISATVTGYTTGAWGTGASANDNQFGVVLTESGSPDTGATPSVQITANTLLTDQATSPLPLLTTASIVATDGAMPILLSFTSTTADGTYGPGSGINITANYSENISSGSITVDLNNTVTGQTLSTITTNTISGTYTVGATGSGEDVTGLDVSAITSQSASDGTNTNSSTTMPSTTIISGSSINVDTTAPTVISATTADNNSNGRIDTLVVVYNEAVNDPNYDAVAVTGYTLPGTGTGSGSATLNYDITESGSPDTGATPAISWTSGNAADLYGNNLNTTGAPANAADGANPVIMTTSPANGATFVLTTANIVVTFSEPMNTGTVTRTSAPDPGGWAVSWDGSNEVATYTHTTFAPLTSYTQTITAGTGADGLGLVAGPVPNPWSFQTMPYSSGGGGGGSASAPTCSLKINNNAISTDNLDVTLTVSITGDVSQLLLSNDSNFPAATWQDYNSTVDWTLAGTATDYGTKTVYAKVKSSGGTMSITCSDEIDYVEPGMADETPAEETEEPTTPPAEETDLVTQDPEPAGPLPSGVSVGTLVKRPDMSTVYFIDQDNRRHAFPDLNTYYSWFSDFSDVQTISAESMSQIPLGSNVVMRPGTYLIKIQSLPHTYAVEPYGVIRWIEDQQIAADLYGSDWNQRIVDVDPSFFVNYQVGSSIDTASHPTGSVVQYEGDTSRYYIQDGVKQLILGSVFSNNKLQSKFVIDNVPESMSYESGANMSMLDLETLMTLR
ncbi:MAG: hypothetical protein GF365_04750 [Candidatus Buchananbacteria bacterium]|nr:hypothetical protein [Candidatus Buchananbacteria bacterium]